MHSLASQNSHRFTVNSTEELIDDAWRLMTDDKLEEAKEVLVGVLDRDPKSFNARTALGHLYLEEGKNDDADRELRQVVEEVLGKREISELDNFEKQAVSLAYLGLGELFMQKDNYSEAEIAFLKAQTAFPNPAAYSLLGILARKYRRDLSLSEVIHKEILEAYPNNFIGNKIYLAITYLLRDEREKAFKLIGELKVEDMKRYPLELSAFYSRAGNSNQAVGYFKKAFNKYSSHPAKQQQILKQIQKDDDFDNLRKTPQFQRSVRNWNGSSFQANPPS